MCSLIKRVDEAFVSKDTSKSLKHKAECFGQAFENLREKWKLGREFEMLDRVFEKLGRMLLL